MDGSKIIHLSQCAAGHLRSECLRPQDRSRLSANEEKGIHKQSLDAETLAARFLGAVRSEISERVVSLKFPGFYGESDLKVSMRRVDGIYYIHDNGCAIGHLAKRTPQWERIEGEMMEAFYWGNDDIGPYREFVSGIAARFGGEFGDRDPCMSADQEDVGSALFRFFNLAVVLSEFGQNIGLKA